MLKEFKKNEDKRGSLIALESQNEIPFQIKRVFYIYDNKMNLSRGQHAHFKTKQLLIALKGSCSVELDNGKDKTVYNLETPNIGLLQNQLIWGNIYSFTKDCILLVLADQKYDKSDYITDYNEFIKVKSEHDESI